MSTNTTITELHENGGELPEQVSYAGPSGPITSLKEQYDAEPPICDYCGNWITPETVKCPALHDGVCEP